MTTQAVAQRGQWAPLAAGRSLFLNYLPPDLLSHAFSWLNPPDSADACEVLMEQGNIAAAIAVAETIRSGLFHNSKVNRVADYRTSAIKAISERLVRCGQTIKAKEVAKMIQPQDPWAASSFEGLVASFIYKADDYGAALEIAKLIPPKLATKACEMIFENAFSNHIEQAIEAAQLISCDATAADMLSRVCSAFVRRGEIDRAKKVANSMSLQWLKVCIDPYWHENKAKCIDFFIARLLIRRKAYPRYLASNS